MRSESIVEQKCLALEHHDADVVVTASSLVVDHEIDLRGHVLLESRIHVPRKEQSESRILERLSNPLPAHTSPDELDARRCSW